MSEIYNARALSDTELVKIIGMKVKRLRLNFNITRNELSAITGVHAKTIGDLENGKNVTMRTLISILRGLKSLELLEQFFKKEPISPLLIAKMENKIPKRASSKTHRDD